MTRIAINEKIDEVGIEGKFVWKPMYLQPLF